jgi:hypothetical protein
LGQGDKQEPPAVGQELGEPQGRFAARGVGPQHQGDGSAFLRHAVERAHRDRREDDRALAPPCPAARVRRIAQRFDLAALDPNRLELAVDEESKRATVRRPERLTGSIRARE